MKMSEIKIGMKVVPFKKTVTGYGGLRHSAAWNTAKEMEQPFLYVIKDSLCPRGAVCCSMRRKAYGPGDYFMPGDLKPYVE